jgi:hypothetical protein
LNRTATTGDVYEDRKPGNGGFSKNITPSLPVRVDVGSIFRLGPRFLSTAIDRFSMSLR